MKGVKTCANVHNMHQPTISIIAAISEKTRALGYKNTLLWHLPEDLKRFKKITTGNPIIMGRKTFDSIGKALPNRLNIVVTKNTEWKEKDVVKAPSLKEALDLGRAYIRDRAQTPENQKNEIFIIGGGEIYAQALPYADKLYLTLVRSDLKGDVFFPEWNQILSKEIFREAHTDPKTGVEYTWIELVRSNTTSK